jgi:hypothetical protein
MGLSCREVQCEVEVLGFYGPWRSRPSGAACRVLGYSFPPLSGESDILFNQEQGSPTVRHSGECWTSVHLGRLASWQLQSSGLSFRGEAGVPALRQGRLDSPVGRRGEKCWASVHFRVAVWCCPQKLAFLFFDGVVGALQLSGTVGSPGLLCISGSGPSGATH